MSVVVTSFQAGLIKKLLERGKEIEFEVFNAIIGVSILNENLQPDTAQDKLKEIFPVTLFNRTVGTSTPNIKQEP